MYDAHVHLQDARLGACRGAVIEAAITAGVTGACCCGTSPDDWAAVAALAADIRPPSSDFALRTAFGVHPWYVAHLPQDWQETLEAALDAHAAAPVGEIGMDGLRPEVPRDLQRRVFERQLELAARLGRPVVLHGARAWGELIAALKPFAPRLPGFVAHAFAGSADTLRDIIALGGHVSFAGSVCSPRAARVRAAAVAAPADRLLVETDTPDILPPGGVSASGVDARLNQPANLTLVIAAVADVRQASRAEIAALTAANARRLYRS